MLACLADRKVSKGVAEDREYDQHCYDSRQTLAEPAAGVEDSADMQYQSAAVVGHHEEEVTSAQSDDRGKEVDGEVAQAQANELDEEQPFGDAALQREAHEQWQPSFRSKPIVAAGSGVSHSAVMETSQAVEVSAMAANIPAESACSACRIAADQLASPLSYSDYAQACSAQSA